MLNENSQRGKWFIKDACGIICAVFTFFLILYAEFVVVAVILFPHLSSFYGIFNLMMTVLLGLLATVSHIRTMLTDPGAIPKNSAVSVDCMTQEYVEKMGFKEGQTIYRCPKCSCIKPDRAHHCSVCKRCIRKMDHHCPWVNNCVGEDNQKYFVLFTLYIATMCIYSLILAGTSFFRCAKTDFQQCSPFSPAATIVLVLFLLFEGVLFAIFTMIMFASQIHAIWNDETGIEQLKREEAKWTRQRRWKNMSNVFGRYSILWLSPFHSPFKHSKSPMYSV
ncbi:palmitoyltransferase ZDHHC3-like [Artemia franciscana]|uniref:palmitoyltransferase ZDHHC3-like n=1 Tax=Artemia franciscana TaxID=6661 RepID=UPI0032DAC774